MNRYICLILLLLAGCGTKPEAGLNIVVLVADALPAGHLGCYGCESPTTPNLDALAAECAVFDDYYTVVPTTLPSFISLLTSRHPKDHGVSWNGGKPMKGLDTLGQAFKSAGYETAFFISSYCLASEFGTSRGFDRFDDRLDEPVDLPQNRLIRTARGVTDAFLDWREGRDESRPHFTVVHYFDPHWPYRPPAEFARYFLDDEGRNRTASYQEIMKERQHLKTNGGRPSKKAKRFRNLHLAEIRYMDHEIGRILEALRSEEQTILVFTSDHGETFWEHEDYFNHGLSVYNTNTRLPLLIRAPGLIEPGRRASPCFSNIDLGPTLLSLISASIPDGFHGRAVPLLFGDGDPSPIFSEATKPKKAEMKGERPNLRKAKSMIMGPWKYIWTPWKAGSEELYHRFEDPLERNNVAQDPEHQRMMAQFKESLKAWAVEFERGTGSEDASPEALKKLEELGYGK